MAKTKVVAPALAVEGQPSGRLSRGTLTREVIVAAALKILDEGPPSGLTFTRLGKELDASPTAMYRHFSSRDEILTEVADELMRLALDGHVPSDDWKASLNDMAVRLWATYAEHPAAATHAFYRVTRGPAEIRAVDLILRAVHKAGWTGHEAVVKYHKFSNLVLSLCGANAAQLAAHAETSIRNPTGWVQAYQTLNPEEYPYVTEAAGDLAAVDYFEVFTGLVEELLATLESEAPNNR
jgi:AcrR family transcriptional regulator